MCKCLITFTMIQMVVSLHARSPRSTEAFWPFLQICSKWYVLEKPFFEISCIILHTYSWRPWRRAKKAADKAEKKGYARNRKHTITKGEKRPAEMEGKGGKQVFLSRVVRLSPWFLEVSRRISRSFFSHVIKGGLLFCRTRPICPSIEAGSIDFRVRPGKENGWIIIILLCFLASFFVGRMIDFSLARRNTVLLAQLCLISLSPWP